MILYKFSPTKLSYLDSGQFIVRYLTDFANAGIDPNTDPDFSALHTALIEQSPIYNQALLRQFALLGSLRTFLLPPIRFIHHQFLIAIGNFTSNGKTIFGSCG
jgi:hypothetical protein